MIRPATGFVLHATAAIVAALAIALAAVAWRLTSGPLSLGFLTPYVADALRQSESPYRVNFADTVLTWAGRGHPLDIRIVDVRIVGPDGSVAATVPEASLRFSIPALLRGMVAPTSLEIIEPKVRMVRGFDGKIELGLGEVADSASGPLELLLADLLAPPNRQHAMGYLKRVSVVGAELTVEDRRLGISWKAPRATVRFLRDDSGIDATGELEIEIGGHAAKVEARARFNSTDGWTRAHFEFADIQPQWLAEGADELAPLAGVRLPVSGSLEVTLDADGSVSQVGFDLNVGAGEVQADDWLDGSLAVTYAQIKGTYMVGAKRFRIDDSIVDFGGPTLAVQGLIEDLANTPIIVADVTIADLPVDDLKHYWPDRIGTATRKWIVANLTDGMIRKVRASFNIKSGDLDGRLPDSAVDATIELGGVTVNYLDPLPKVVGVDGVAKLSGRTVEITTSGGRLERLRAGAGLISFDDIGGANLTTIDLAVSGPIDDAIELLAHPRLRYAQLLGIEAENAGGNAESNLHFAFQLNRELTLGGVTVTANARLRDASLTGAVETYDLSRGILSLTLDGQGMDIAGSVALNDVPAEVAWRRTFGTNAEFLGRYTLTGRFTDAQRAVLGIPGEEIVSGPVEVKAVIIEWLDGRRSWEISADITEAAVRIDAIRWSKPAGVEGTFRVDAWNSVGAPFVVEILDVTAGDLIAYGSAEFDAADWRLRRLELSLLEYGDTKLQATVVPIEEDGYGITLSGASWDLRPFLETGIVDTASKPLPTLDLNVRLDRIIVREDYPLTEATVIARARGGRWDVLSFDGRLDGVESVTLRLGADDASGRTLMLTSDDAGGVLRSFDIFDNVIGGKLTLSVALDDGDGPAIGELTIEDFTLIRAPTLAKILSIASFTGVFNLLTGDGLPFTNLIMPFTKTADALDITDGRSFGAALGITIEGRVDLGGDKVDLNGTLVPAYTLNSVIGKVPLLGALLVGPKGGGVFAATYRIAGPLKGPTIVVNPLAAFAPGVLRKLFFFSTGTGDVEPYDEEDPESVR